MMCGHLTRGDNAVPYESITYEADDRVAIITLNRPEKMNALTLGLCDEVVDAVQRFDADDDQRVMVIRGAGGKAFSAGYDLNEGAESQEVGERGVDQWRWRLNHDLQFTYSVWRCNKPVIAMIEGYCLAGGLEFAQMCDIRYASDDSQFAVIETRFSNGVATLAMPWVIGQMSRELIFTGDIIDAREALRIGLVNRVFPKADLERETMKIAKRMSRVALDSLRWNKRAINNTFETMGFNAALQYGLEACSIMDATQTPEYRAFQAVKLEKGLTEAIRWRRAQFQPFE
jgi:enoyl-CoA hydratase